VGEELALLAAREIRARLWGGDVEFRKVLLLFRHSPTILELAVGRQVRLGP
jgi:hypothetical protein